MPLSLMDIKIYVHSVMLKVFHVCLYCVTDDI